MQEKEPDEADQVLLQALDTLGHLTSFHQFELLCCHLVLITGQEQLL